MFAQASLQSSDLVRLRSVSGVHVSPDGTRVTYTVDKNDGDVGTEAIMVRYPREGHGIRESKHVVDSIDRIIRWYDTHFPAATPKS